jgi:dephospho-CoA kinase
MAVILFGIAGYMGAGKSTAARFLAARLAPALIIDADREAKMLMNTDPSVMEQLAAAFGGSIIGAGGIDFSALGRIVFSSLEKLKRLNAIVHPPLEKRLLACIENSGGKNVLLDAALLPHWGIESRFDACLWVQAPFETRLARLLQSRSDLDEASLRNRMRLQEESLAAPLRRPWQSLENRESIDALDQALSLIG